MSSHNNLSREEFRNKALQRDNHNCIVPWCSEEASEVHHIIERKLWNDEGYYLRNAASVCNPHHRYAEQNYIPPQAFWEWLKVEPVTPENHGTNIDKWGNELETPPWTQHRSKIKYPSTGHLPFSPEWDGTRVDFTDVDMFLEIPLVITYKMDGSNAMLVKDLENPVRARNGKYAEHQSFDMLKKLYRDKNLYSELPRHIQVFGEWLYAKHSIHYGCNCDPKCEDVGPELSNYFQVFGIFDTRYNLWLSWPEVKQWSKHLGFPTVPQINGLYRFSTEQEFYSEGVGVLGVAQEAVKQGDEGITVRPRFPFHYGQFSERLGKYVREGHVDPGETHWSKNSVTQNVSGGDRDGC